MINALRNLNITAKASGRNDLEVEGKKVIIFKKSLLLTFNLRFLELHFNKNLEKILNNYTMLLCLDLLI